MFRNLETNYYLCTVPRQRESDKNILKLKLEKGYSISIPTISRVFQALGVTTATLDLGGTIGKIALW